MFTRYNSPRRAGGFISLLATLLLFLISPAAHAEPLELKAAFIYRLATMTTWPEEALGDADETLCFAVVGDDALAQALTGILDGRRLHERRAKALAVSSPADLTDCLVTFLSGQLELESIPESTISARLPTLTLGDGEDFAEHGGMIQFIREGRHLRFIVNLKALEDRGLKLSSKVLRLARGVLR